MVVKVLNLSSGMGDIVSVVFVAGIISLCAENGFESAWRQHELPGFLWVTRELLNKFHWRASPTRC